MTSRREARADDFLYRVFEEVDGKLVSRMVGSHDGGKVVDYNAKTRLYTDFPTAAAYVRRLRKEGRQARCLRYVYESERTVN